MMQQLVTTHSLEISDPQELVPGASAAPAYDLRRVEIPCPPLNRFLYATVGADWWWYQRLPWSYAQWNDFLQREEVSTWVAYVRGTPAGYFELEMQSGQSVEVAYFGLLPQFVGQGLGGALLTDAVEAAWSLGASRVWLHTCSLDHPSALSNYQARGFRIFRTEEATEELPDEALQPWDGAFPAQLS